MAATMKWATWRCRRRGHDWFPGLTVSEFVPMYDSCLRCRAVRWRMPWGDCIGGHPIAEHYSVASDNDLVTVGALPQCRTGWPA